MTEPARRRVAILADDLIWASRLSEAVRRAGADAVKAADTDAGMLLVDLNGRGYDGIQAVSEAAAAGTPVVAVGQHEDVELRRRALAAGARQVYSYNRFHREGPALIQRLLAAIHRDAA